MKIITIPPQGIFAVNCYLTVSEAGNAALTDAPEGADRIIAEAEKNGVKIKKILLTHGHCDHIESLAEIAARTGAEVYIHKLDAGKLTDSYTNLSEFFAQYLEKPAEPYRGAICLSDGDKVQLDELTFTVLHTPGHTSGSVCYIAEDVMFSGDTLFKNSIGRTDMPDGDQLKLFGSLKLLENFRGEYEDYRLLSGHGAESTLKRERDNNPFMNGNMFDC
ncbi:MAG: MBL fold metallo-hydrolase [Prevotella sp.]|nr:MBL fold metallo-hydrolase [Prevotella sp.]